MKYSFEEKLKAVKLHLECQSYCYPEDCDTCSKKVRYNKAVKFWEAQYLLNGEEGIRHPIKNKVYTAEEKYVIIQPVLLYEVSLTQQSKNTGIYSGQLVSWIKRYKERGMDGLKCSKRGRKKNMKSNEEAKIESVEEQPKKKRKSNKDLEKENEELKQQNLILRAELEYRKKLQALVEDKERQARMRKQKSSTNSSKAKHSKGK